MTPQHMLKIKNAVVVVVAAHHIIFAFSTKALIELICLGKKGDQTYPTLPINFIII